MDLNVLENPFKSIRKYLTERTSILEVITGLTVFESAASGQMILLLRNQNIPSNLVRIKNGLFNLPIKRSQQEIIKNNFSWTLSQNLPFLSKLESGSVNLYKIAEIHTGVAVYAAEEGKRAFLKTEKEKNCYPLLTGGESIKFSYCSSKPTMYLLYDKNMEKEFNDKFDKEYFSHNGSHQRPFNLRRINEYDRPKIILRQSDSKLTGTYSEDLIFGNYSLFNIFCGDNNKSLLKYILALFNSRLLTYYAREKEIILVKPGKTPQIRSGQRGPIGIRQLPIKKISTEDQKPFISIVDKILEITKSDDYLKNPQEQSQVKAYERQIDQMVYDLYGLTDEEIRIVRGHE